MRKNRQRNRFLLLARKLSALAEIARRSLTYLDDIERISGTSGDDTITGNALSNTIYDNKLAALHRITFALNLFTTLTVNYVHILKV